MIQVVAFGYGKMDRPDFLMILKTALKEKHNGLFVLSYHGFLLSHHGPILSYHGYHPAVDSKMFALVLEIRLTRQSTRRPTQGHWNYRNKLSKFITRARVIARLVRRIDEPPRKL
jgi:hypothetical protein